MDDDRLDLLVREAKPLTVAPDPALLHRMARDIARPPLLRRRLVAVPLAAGVALSLAAAGYMTWHDSASGDFERVVAEHTARLELPPGADRAAYAAQLREQGSRSPSSVSDLAIASSAAYYGVCAWLTAWDRRHTAGDTAGAAQAVEGLNRAVDAGPLAATDGGGVVGNLRRVAAAAARGDRTPVSTELRANCSGLPLDGIR
ncbi:hypothetical protein GCM10010112_20610 [Actinoplanes lobatus]|uniref:Uncharacterized protein n=1 Tax=Actinoplanes lobatus TaxID=113568 RepID=A0A7W7HPI2_9ACTN|nr:hypothetical protein [Actinoplanes lobatus]MBB4754316.1 hypothetical protein [Actinoplanes lobatus]GGN62451.1 hypothetical protein GCM10010112_20610 [Actinoplanes lobatus]GIE45124.1 hypothetical protein Alo02nite_80220 [Actinoplanes lobatus]